MLAMGSPVRNPPTMTTGSFGAVCAPAGVAVDAVTAPTITAAPMSAPTMRLRMIPPVPRRDPASGGAEPLSTLFLGATPEFTEAIAMSSTRQAGEPAAAPASIGRRQRKKQELRERIVDAATALIAQQGLSNTTVDQIAEACDIAQATFFNHFASKGVLLDAVVGRLTGAFNQILEGMDTKGTSRIELMFTITAALTASEQRMVREILTESARTWSDPTLEAINHTRELHIADIAAGQKRGDIRKDHSAADLADAALGLYFSVLLFWNPTNPETLSTRL